MSKFRFFHFLKNHLIIFDFKSFLFLFFGRYQAKGFNFCYRIYSSGIVFKLHSKSTLSKNFMFLFTCSLLNVSRYSLRFVATVIMWGRQYFLCQNDLFWEGFVSDGIFFQKSVRSVKPMQNVIFNHHFKQNVYKSCIEQVTFGFTNEKEKYTDAVCICQNGIEKYPLSHVFLINFPSIFSWKKECFREFVGKTCKRYFWKHQHFSTKEPGSYFYGISFYNS